MKGKQIRMTDPRNDLLQIFFHDIPSSPSVETSIHESFAKLARFHDWMTGCRVTVLAETGRAGNRDYLVSIAIELPDRGTIIHRENARGGTNPDLALAIRTSFTKVARQLDRQAGRMDGGGRRHRHARQAVG